nr:nucleotidyltransferase family protein [Oscillospiraceae bacterium]
GLGNLLFAAAREEPSLDGVLSAAKSKRYALSRLRRMCMCAALGIKSTDSEGLPPYARVLSANDTGRSVLKIMSEKSAIPVITKPASVKELSLDCRRLFQLESSAHDLYVMGYSAKEERRGNADWRTSPKII